MSLIHLISISSKVKIWIYTIGCGSNSNVMCSYFIIRTQTINSSITSRVVSPKTSNYSACTVHHSSRSFSFNVTSTLTLTLTLSKSSSPNLDQSPLSTHHFTSVLTHNTKSHPSISITHSNYSSFVLPCGY